MTAVFDHPVHGPYATIHSPRSRYDGRYGYVVERDEEGGYEVAFPGAVPSLVHFEASELEFERGEQR